MKCITLVDAGGSLAVPLTHADADTQRWYGSGSGGALSTLIYRYPAGDCDTFKWPLDATYRGLGEQRDQIRSAMYDCREMGFFPSTVGSVSLPDGDTLEF